MSYQSEALLLSPAIYWSLDEGTGTATDQTANGNNGTYVGDTAAAFKQFDDIGATNFHGYTSGVHSASITNGPTGDFSLSWLSVGLGRPDSTIFSYATATSADNFRVSINSSGNLRLHIRGNIATLAHSPMAHGVGHYVLTWELSTGNYVLYRNGTSIITGSIGSGTAINSTGVLYIGQDQDSVGGSLDEGEAMVVGTMGGFFMTTDIITSGEVTTLYNEITAEAQLNYWEEADTHLPSFRVAPTPYGSGSTSANDNALIDLERGVTLTDLSSGLNENIISFEPSIVNGWAAGNLDAVVGGTIGDFADNTSTLSNSTEMTIVFWAKDLPSDTDRTLINLTATGGDYDDMRIEVGGLDDLKFVMDPGAHEASWPAGVDPHSSSWQMFAVTWDNADGMAHFYVDGVEIGTGTSLGNTGETLNSGNYTIHIGPSNESSARMLESGTFDGVVVIPTALPASDLLDLYRTVDVFIPSAPVTSNFVPASSSTILAAESISFEIADSVNDPAYTETITVGQFGMTPDLVYQNGAVVNNNYTVGVVTAGTSPTVRTYTISPIGNWTQSNLIVDPDATNSVGDSNNIVGVYFVDKEPIVKNITPPDGGEVPGLLVTFDVEDFGAAGLTGDKITITYASGGVDIIWLNGVIVDGNYLVTRNVVGTSPYVYSYSMNGFSSQFFTVTLESTDANGTTITTWTYPEPSADVYPPKMQPFY